MNPERPIAKAGETTVSRSDTGPVAPQTSESAPTVPGYQIFEEVGRGGMGVVYRARDLVLGRDVAVKLLGSRFPIDGPAARRFVEEARITAQLQHPGVPPVYRVATLVDGRPLLAMKLVKGQTLDAMLRARRDVADERSRFVAAFEGVCQAMAYAHAHRVVHRDLKPTNVMVGAFGETQVMDWGLAKVLSATEPNDAPIAGPATEVRGRDSGQETHAGSLLGTPAYMPPEQAVGAVDQVDARSDVFCLGGILCAVLTGKPPYVGVDGESTRQMAARAELTDAHARLEACGAEAELIALCRRCLAPAPADRPADAGAVAEAVARWRADADRRVRDAETAAAAAAVRAAEEAKRRRTILIAAAALILSLVGGIVGTVAGLREATSAQKSAEQDRDKARIAEGKATSAAEVATRALGEAEVSRIRAVKARDRALEVLDAMTSDVAGDTLMRKANLTPEQQAFLVASLKHYEELAAEQGDGREARAQAAFAARRVGVLQGALGKTSDAIRSMRRALELFTSLAMESHDPEYQRGVASVQNSLAMHLRDAGQADEDLFRQSAAGFDAVASTPAGLPTDRLNAAIAELNLASVGESRIGVDDARKHLFSARRRFETLVEENPEASRTRRHLATTLNQIGNFHCRSDAFDPKAAVEAYRAARDLRTALLKDQPDDRKLIDDLATTLNNHGLLLDNLLQPREALAELTQSIALRERLVAETPGAASFRIDLGSTYANVGRLHRRHFDAKDAIPWFDKAAKLLSAELNRAPQNPSLRIYVRNTLAGRASALGTVGRHADACPDWDKVVELCQPPEVPRHRALRAVCFARAGRTDAALAEARMLLESPMRWSAAQQYDFAVVLALAAEHDAAAREPLANEAIAQLTRVFDSGWSDRAKTAADPAFASLRSRADFKALVAGPGS